MSDRVPEHLPEGREAPPPGVRAMATVRWSLVTLMVLAAAGAWIYWADVRGKPAQGAISYQCPMHPSVIQGQAGDCPICGMSLVQIEPGARKASPPPASAAAGPGKYWCPMHPEIHSDDPGARCEKCGGMKLVPREPSARPPPGPGKYWCPMHPEVHSDDPEAICEKCRGAKLVAREPEARKGLAGLVPVEIGAERIQLMGIRTAKVVRERLAPQLRTVGFVSANESTLAIITARFTGWVEELKVGQSGQRVDKGQVLATVYSPELTNSQQVYVNALRWSKDPSGVAPTGAAVGANLDQDARRRLELLGLAQQDIAEIGRAGKPLTSPPIRSPVAGYVARRGALPGLYFTPGTELFQIADLSSVWVIADIYEYDMSRVKVGQRAALSLGAYPGERFVGKVQFIYPAVNPESRTLQARMEFRNPGLKLRPGMYGDVVIDLDAAESLAVPTEAIVDTGEIQYVFIARPGGRFEPRQIRTGARTEERIQVLEGLAQGDTVVTTANFLVDSESRLRAAVEGFTPRDEAAEREEKQPEGAEVHRGQGPGGPERVR